MRSPRFLLSYIRSTLTRPEQRTAHLGDFPLENGDVIRNCIIGYRTCGRLNATRSNAVLVVPWFQGTSGQVARQVGPGKLVDSSRYFVIAVDALGNGVSSSPSNSAAQRGPHFPTFSIRDMVESQHQLVTRTLDLSHLHAVVGISMGGMQVFQWMVDHPAFIDKGVSIVGSPQSHPDDRLRWQTYIAFLQANPVAARVGQAIWRGMPRTALNELLLEPHDHSRQGAAILKHDIAAAFGGDMTRAATAMRGDLLVVGTWTDREVNPNPAFEFARRAGAEIQELDGRCGHQAPSCDQETLWRAVDRFLAAHPRQS
jgi:homoserine O-acetyltransferase